MTPDFYFWLGAEAEEFLSLDEFAFQDKVSEEGEKQLSWLDVMVGEDVDTSD